MIVAPISGGCFPSQLVALREACPYFEKYGRPQLALTGSGGTVSVYCYSAGRMTYSGVTRVATTLNNSILIKEPQNGTFDVIPSYVTGLLQGAMYQTSELSRDFFASYFNKESVQALETWSCSINQESGRAALFCNRGRESCLINGNNYDRRSFNSEPLCYLRGNITNITRSILASASIPVVLSPITIGGQKYVDCGAKFGSALTPLQDEVRHLPCSRHILYCSAYDVEESLRVTDNRKVVNVLDVLEKIPTHVTRGLVQQDRRVALGIIMGHGSSKELHTGTLEDIRYLRYLLKARDRTEASLIETYPIEYNGINILNFNGKTVVDSMDNVRMGVHVWWMGSPSAFSDVKGFVTHRINVCNELR
jgi:hypothetical protein